ncbi:DUF6773 family protein [Clostridium manihotivorum]|uniref:Uncharacterized protein n=1 Tax=Clostridium manihotivorum TaxID=2320868 RepID=A0A3R5QVS0_9CLOT|nr:DUF6773 family protein [Clostridium manihotivorum]QAA33400.1 hypothetical protein C1I91_18090 [Clostridium manihotivorum]
MKYLLKDERIKKKENEILAQMFLLILVMIGILLILKLIFLEITIKYYVFDIGALLISIGYLILRSLISGVPLLKTDDEYLKQLQSKYRAHCFYICIHIYLAAVVVSVFLLDMVNFWSFYYSAICILPSYVYGKVAIKNGLFTFGGKKREARSLRNLKINALIGGLCFVGYNIIMEIYRGTILDKHTLIGIAIVFLIYSGVSYFKIKHDIYMSEEYAEEQISGMVYNDENEV